MAIAILDARGWECGNSMLNTVDANSLTAVAASTLFAKTGSYSLRFASTARWGRWAVPGAVTDPALSVWTFLSDNFNTSSTVSGLSGTGSIAFVYSLSDGTYIGIRWNAATHTYDAYVGDVLTASGTIEVSVNDWFQVQVYIDIALAGSIEVLIDGHQSINYSGDTRPSGGAPTVTYLYGLGTTSFIDDLVWGSGGFLGDLRCYDLRPTADTLVDDWTPSVGVDNYATIDETPPSDTDYNEAATTGFADELELSDFDDTEKSPVFASAWVRARMFDGTGDSIKVGVDSGGTDDTTTHPLSTQWEYYFHPMDEDPATGIEWGDPGLDALKLRYEAVIT